MGGNALKTLVAKRMKDDEYNIIKAEILDILGKHYVNVCVPIEKPGKIDHGDLDVLCQKLNGATFNPYEKLHSKEVTRNGHVVSFEYKGHQIDIIHVDTNEEFDFSKVFYSYGDTGMILGMVCNTIGLIMGSKKLAIHLPEPLSNTKMMLTNDIHKVLHFLGLSFTEWTDGFQSEKEVFQWITSSKYFRKEMFSRLNSDRKKKDKDRPMFHHFVQYCEETAFTPKPKILVQDVFIEAIKFFNKEQEYVDLVEKNKLTRRVHSKFNGCLIMKLTGLANKQLGELIKKIKAVYSEEALDALTENEIQEIIFNFWKSQ